MLTPLLVWDKSDGDEEACDYIDVPEETGQNLQSLIFGIHIDTGFVRIILSLAALQIIDCIMQIIRTYMGIYLNGIRPISHPDPRPVLATANRLPYTLCTRTPGKHIPLHLPRYHYLRIHPVTWLRFGNCPPRV